LKAECFSIDAAHDSKAGLLLANLNPYDWLIVDLMLPGMTGPDLIRRVREQNSDVPIVVLTAQDGISDKVTNFEAGADDYLTKAGAGGPKMPASFATIAGAPFVERCAPFALRNTASARLVHITLESVP